jgi:hypothetical protein
MTRNILLVVFLLCIPPLANFAQVGINTITPASSAELDIFSNSKGVLLPALTDAQMRAIATPAQGLIVYNTTIKNYYYFNGAIWAKVGTKGSSLEDTDRDTKIQVEKTADEDVVRIDLGQTASSAIENYVKINSTGVHIADELFLRNTSFEPPHSPALPPASFTMKSADEFIGWETTAPDNLIEIWSDGYIDGITGQPMSAPKGMQFVELNANFVSRLYQEVMLKNGQTFSWRYWHRGRAGTDVAELNIYSLDGITKLATLQTASTGMVWTEYTGSWTVTLPTGKYQFSFESISTSTGDQGVGNMLDGVETSLSSFAGNYKLATGNTLEIGGTPLIFPATKGGNSTVLSTDGAGNWHWAEPHGGLGIASGIESMYFAEARSFTALGSNTFYTPVIPFSSMSVDTLAVYVATVGDRAAIQGAIYNAQGDTIATSLPYTPLSAGILKMRLRGSGYGSPGWSGPTLSAATQYYFAVTCINNSATQLATTNTSTNIFTRSNTVTAPARLWDFITDQEGWNSPVQMTASAASSINTITITGSDARFLSPTALGVNASVHKYLIVRLQNQTTNTICQLYWTTTTDGAWNSAKSATFQITAMDASYRYYIIDLSSIASWTGTVQQIRFDPANGPSTGTVLLDYIKLGASYEILEKEIGGSSSQTPTSVWGVAF